MRASGHPDCFVVISGPEDGTEFPVTRTPVFIGQDPGCAVNVRLDTAVRPYHARVTAASEGYRIRSAEGAPVYVEGKRAGTVRSRILRPGGNLQVGYTLLALECSADGLASRSHGIAVESDAAWAMKRCAASAWSLARWLLGWGFRMLGHVLNHWKFIALLVMVVLYVFYPPFQAKVNFLFRFVRFYIQNFLGLIGRFVPTGG